MTENKRKTGTYYEQMAGTYLKAQGYDILRYNYRCRLGEIDIIARDGSYLVFCEVKYRRDSSKGLPAEAVTLRKQQVICRCAMYFVTTEGLGDLPCRFDVVGITGSPQEEQIELIKNAFDYAG